MEKLSWYDNLQYENYDGNHKRRDHDRSNFENNGTVIGGAYGKD